MSIKNFLKASLEYSTLVAPKNQQKQQDLHNVCILTKDKKKEENIFM